MSIGDAFAASLAHGAARLATTQGIDDASRALAPRMLSTMADVGLSGGIVRSGERALGSGDVLLSWGVEPWRLRALDAAEQQGARVINNREAVRTAANKANLGALMSAAGIDFVQGTPARTADEVQDAVAALGGKARITGGYSHSELRPAADAATSGSTPIVELIDGEAALHNFVRNHVDNASTFLVQPHDEAATLLQPTLVNGHVIDLGAPMSRIGGIDVETMDIARRALQTVGLEAGSVELARTGRQVRVLDVHATPRLPEGVVERMSRQYSVREALQSVPPAPPATPLRDAMQDAQKSIGLVSMGARPGKNNARVLAEIEKQGARPIYVPAKDARVAADGALHIGGRPAPRIDAYLTRTGAVISDDAISLLDRLEQGGALVLNRASSMANVRDKNTQSTILHGAQVAHPTSAVVAGAEDAARAVEDIGVPIVLKNPASSEGRGVMFLADADAARGAAALIEHKTDASQLIARKAGVAGSPTIAINDREHARDAIHALGDVESVATDAGIPQLAMRSPIELVDEATGHSVVLDRPVSVLSVGDAFRDAKPGAVLKAEPWYLEAAGVDTRVHVVRRSDGTHDVIAAMQRRAAPNEYGEARSNLSLGGVAEGVELDAAERAVALQAARAFDLDVAGVDLLATRNGPVVLEVNSSPGLDIEKTVGSVARHWVESALERIDAHRLGQRGA